MDFIETILAKAITGDLTEVTEKEILLASLYELKSVKKELESLNDKIDILEVKIDETAKASVTTTQLLDSKYDKRLLDLEARVKINEDSRMERTIIQKIISYIPHALAALATAFVIYDYVKAHIGK